MTHKPRLLNQTEVEALISQLADKLRNHLEQSGIQAPLMIGIHTGGAWVAQRLHQTLELPEPLGILDISFYRDDFTRIGMNPKVQPSEMPFSVENRHVILVDDVLQSGRTIRAAMNEVFDFGRPTSISLAVLVVRSGRELPIEPQASALHLDDPDQPVTLTGPEPLSLIIGPTKHEARAAANS